MWKKKIPDEPDLRDSERIRSDVRIGYKRSENNQWNYYILCQATCDQIADEVAKRILLGSLQVTVKKIMNEE